MVVNLWAIQTVVLPSETLSRVAWISNSFFLSKAEVASSSNKIGGFFKIALAIANLCFCPPERALPLVPTYVLSLSGSWSTKSLALAFLRAS
mmetsp:Transcript_16791/g.14690  ORF Transcript_16791/g.14690 Transcript_16791/m.14690 type:complete len:92 (-) Transcript_16791:399-674(-)